MDQGAFENVVSKIKDVHDSLDDDGKKVLVALRDQAERGAGGNVSDRAVPLTFAPDRTVTLASPGEKGACW